MAHPPLSVAAYKVQESDIALDNFFYSYEAKEWTFPSYSNWHRSVHKTKKFARITADFQVQLEKIKNSKKLPEEVKAYAGDILIDMKVCVFVNLCHIIALIFRCT